MFLRCQIHTNAEVLWPFLDQRIGLFRRLALRLKRRWSDLLGLDLPDFGLEIKEETHKESIRVSSSIQGQSIRFSSRINNILTIFAVGEGQKGRNKMAASR